MTVCCDFFAETKFNKLPQELDNYPADRLITEPFISFIIHLPENTIHK